MYSRYDGGARELRGKCLANLHRLPSATGEPAVDKYGVVSVHWTVPIHYYCIIILLIAIISSTGANDHYYPNPFDFYLFPALWKT